MTTKREELLAVLQQGGDAEDLLERLLDCLKDNNRPMNAEFDRMQMWGTYPWGAWSGMIDFIRNHDKVVDD